MATGEAGHEPHQSEPVSARFLQMRIITWVRKERAVDELHGTERAVD